MESIDIALDLTLAATSGAAVLYCAVLSRRLATLRSAKGGVAPAIETLTQAVRDSRASAEAISQAADAAVRRLNAAYAELDGKRQATEDLVSVLDGQAASAERRMAHARADAEAAVAGALAPLEDRAGMVVQTTERTLTVLARRARIELEALSDAVDIAGRVARLADPASDAPNHEAEDGAPSAEAPSPNADPISLDASRGAVRQRPAAGSNPFLRAVGS